MQQPNTEKRNEPIHVFRIELVVVKLLAEEVEVMSSLPEVVTVDVFSTESFAEDGEAGRYSFNSSSPRANL